MLDPEIQAMMTAQVYVATAINVTHAGDPVYGAVGTTPIMARVEPHVSFVRTGPDGEDVNSSHAVLTPTRLNTNDKVWLPGTDRTVDRQARIVKSISPMLDEDGAVSHYEVLV